MKLEDVARDWRPEPVEDETIPDPSVGAAAAGLWNEPPPEGTVPPLWHWFHFLEWPPHCRLGADGHPADGHFLPPIDDRRRMFAGGTCVMNRPLRYGQAVRRRRALRDVRHKTGRTGELVFVTIRSELSQQGTVCIIEDQNIVYRSGQPIDTGRTIELATEPPPIEDGSAALHLQTDPALLFRMSALTANHHRIHYDQSYTTGIEHYPALVVHGPLLILHMLEMSRRQAADRLPTTITYRLMAPVFVGEPLAAIADPPAGPSQSLRIATAREQCHATARLQYGEAEPRP